MNITFFIVIGLLILSMAAPFITLYAVSLIRKKNYSGHIKIQKTLFWIFVVGVIILELQIRFSGGSGSLVAESKYAETAFFNVLLIAHIIGAVLTFLIWGFTIFNSNRKWKGSKVFARKLLGNHKKLGYITIAGQVYTSVSALMVCTMAFFL
ncbi:MAG: DUF420 domain-containing protein [Bacteroidetes bacterium]|jgi:hypothetical protein|nr:DUF420 domain-containing protein [Bacteroidota bacterium]